MNKVAVVGAGGSAEVFLQQNAVAQFDLFTSSGEGEVQGIKAQPLSTLRQNDYAQIYILIYALEEVIHAFDFTHLEAEIYWFNAKNRQLFPVRDPYGESIVEVNSQNNDTLTVIYDLRVEPLTYDFLIFLVDAEMERRKRNLAGINLIIAPGDFSGFNKEWRVEADAEKAYRIHNLLVPIVQLLPCKVYFHFCSTRKDARILWQTLPNNFPAQHNFLKPSQRHRYYLIKNRIEKGECSFVFADNVEPYRTQVTRWLQQNKIRPEKMVTITLRETFRATSRNSKLSEWYKLADILNQRGYDVVFVRDVNRCFEPLAYKGKHKVFDAPCLNVVVRKELYQCGFANLLINNGVAVINYFHEAIRYLSVGLINPDYPDCSEEVISGLGYSKHAIIGAKPWQRVSWESDNFENLLNEFNKLEKIINEHF